MAADYPEDCELRPAVLAELGNLVREADALYASHHYHVYHFLLTLSDVAGGKGWSTASRQTTAWAKKAIPTMPTILPEADLLSHEFTHSWNGKYRRPAGLYQPDFATPQQGALLWVYEGMTEYLGDVLAARCGFETPAQYRDLLADNVRPAWTTLRGAIGDRLKTRPLPRAFCADRTQLVQLEARAGLLRRRRACCGSTRTR